MSGYVENNLNVDENIVHKTKLHWVLYLSMKALGTLFISPAIERATSEFAITNKRIIIKIVLFTRDAFELNLSKVESVNVHQTLMGRLFNYGSIFIVGTGGSKEYFHNIKAPVLFKKKFQEISA